MGLYLRAAVVFGTIFLLAAGGVPEEADKEPLSERTIYIPYKDLEKVFEKEGRGVFLPYPQFLELWERARAGGADTIPPVGSVTASGHYDGSLVGDVATFRASFSFEVLREGWTEIPLALGGLALSEAKAQGEGAILRAHDGEYRLVVPGRGRYGLEVTFGLAVEEKGGYKSISFNTPRAAVSKLKVVIPGKDLDVTLEPNLAATINETDQGTEVLAFLGASDRIGITWRPRARLMAPGEALISAEATQKVTVDEGVVQASATYALNVLRTRVPGFALQFPSGYKVTGLEGPGIRKWKVSEEGNQRVVEVTLDRGVEGEYALSLSIEKVDAGFPGDGATLEVPRIGLRGARRERGVMAIFLGPDLRAKVSERTGATQVDVSDLGAEGKGAAFGFRYPQHPFTVKLDVEKVEPRVRADALSIVSIDDDRIDLVARYRHTIQRGGLFRLHLLLPEGYEVIDVKSPSGLRDHRVTASDDGPVLEIDLPKRETRGIETLVRLERRRESAEGDVALPFLRALGVAQETGSVGVSLLESLKAVSRDVIGLFPKDVREVARGGLRWPGDQELTLGFSYQKHPISAILEVTRKESQVTGRVQTTLEAKEDLVKVKTLIRFEVQYAGVKSFRFTLPKGIGKAENIQGADIKEKRSEEDPEGKVTTWDVSLQREVLGEYVLTLEYDLKLEKKKVGETVTVAIPELELLDIFREEGYIAARKEPNVILATGKKSDSLNPVDPRELPGSMRAQGAFLAYQYFRHPVELEVQVTRYDFSEVLPTMVGHLHTDSVLTEEGAIRCEASLSLQNKQRQFLRVRLPEAAEVTRLLVDGKEKQPSVVEGDPGIILIDLAEGGKQGDVIRIRIRYDLPRTSPGGLGAVARHRVQLPVIEGDPGEEGLPPPVARLSLNLYVPEGRAYLGFSTTMRRIGAPLYFWERIKRALFGGRRQDAGGRQVLSAGASLAASASGGDGAGDLVKGGEVYSFYKLEGGGEVTVTHISGPLDAALDIAILVGLLAAGVILPRRKIISANLAVFGLAGVVVVLLALAPEPFRPYLHTALLAALLLALIWAGLFAVTERRRLPGGDLPPPLETVPPGPTFPQGGEGSDRPGTVDLEPEPPGQISPRRKKTSARVRKPRKTKGGEE